VGLGHRRLSIVDVSGGHQPMSNEDGRVWITYNGEVYNHAGFRSRLEGNGHRYKTRCDTEAIIHLYEELGASVARELQGMFAFAIWDERRDTLLLARDRLGIKPLYYALSLNGDLVFASEIKSIFTSGLIEAELDATAVREYFASGHSAGGRTLYRGVRKLQPGHVLTWRDGAIDVQAYWRIGDQPYSTQSRSVPTPLDDNGDQFWERFRESVQSMLMSDVPLGVFLSGGLDSSLIVAAMRECGDEHMCTFLVGYDEAYAN